MSLIDCLKGKFSVWIVDYCSDDHCNLKLNTFQNRIVLNIEKHIKDRKMCDNIVFIIMNDGKIITAIVEFKSKTAHASEIEEKLTNGVEFANKILNECEAKFHDFYHIVLAKSYRSIEHDMIKYTKIKYQGRKYDIYAKKCGISLHELIQ